MCQLVKVKTNLNTEILVADIKADYIVNMLKKADLCKNICKIYLFGSVLEERCQDDSDIDILVVSDISRSKLYKTKDFQRFLIDLHEKDDYIQQYDILCVHGLEELKRKKRQVALYQDVLINGKEIFRRKD